LLFVFALVAICQLAMLSGAYGQTFAEGNPLRGQGDPSSKLDPEDQVGDLVQKAIRLADRFDRLEMLAGRLAELSRSTQPRRAKLLRELISQSHDLDIEGRFHGIIDSLQNHSLSSAHNQQQEMQIQLRKLLELLLREDQDRQLESQRKRVRKYLSDIKRLMRLQRGVKARTDGGEQTEQLSAGQQRIAQGAEKLQQDIVAQEGLADSAKLSEERTPRGEGQPTDAQSGKAQKGDGPSQRDSQDAQPQDVPGQQKSAQGEPAQGKPASGQQPNGQSSSEIESPPSGLSPQDQSPSGGQGAEGQRADGQAPSATDAPSPASPMQRAQQKIEKAHQKMKAAQQKLEKAQRAGAVEQQEQALRELEQAKAELERILRQLREEELERALVMLEARFRKMLEMQIEVHEETQRLDSRQSAAPSAVGDAHEVEIASGRLSRKERQIVQEADRAMILLREDGSSVAFPETLEQAREDMQSVADRLSEIRLGRLTQGLEEDIIAALEESLAALQQALKELRNSQGKPKPGGSPSEQALVDQLAELRMIRSLQQRVNRRTERYGKLIAGEQATKEEIVTALDQLALREERIYQATHDLHTKKNQ
jgi:hypothetical protein